MPPSLTRLAEPRHIAQGATQVTGYFPQGKWYSLWDDKSSVDASRGGTSQTLKAPLGDIPIHVRGGSILPMQGFAMTTAAVRATPLSLLAAMPADLVSLDVYMSAIWDVLIDLKCCAFMQQGALAVLQLARCLPACRSPTLLGAPAS